MSRTPLVTLNTSIGGIETPGLNPAEIDAETRALVEIDARYGDIIPYHRDRIIQETRFLLNQSAEAMLEAGRRLILLKEHEPHGDFISALEKIGLDRYACARLMRAAAKFSNVRAHAHLNKLGRTKLLELAFMDTEEADVFFEQGGTVRGLTYDDVDKMTHSELRAALRKQREDAKQQADLKDLIIKKKDEKLNQLDEQVAALEMRQRTATPAEIETKAREAFQETAMHAKAMIMAGLRSAIKQLIDETPGEHRQFVAGYLIEIGRELTLLRDEYNLPRRIDETPNLDPTWQLVMAEMNGTKDTD